jgi:hypothetical protein
MSDFKFACPVCGQHITCDSASSGTQMDCPTCFRKLVVPQATAATSPNFVLTASEVQKRPATAPGNGAKASSSAVTEAPRKSVPTVAIVLTALVVCVAGAGVFAFRGKIFHPPPPPPPPPPPVVTNAPAVATQPVLPILPLAADATNWTLNLAEAKIPDAPASGSINGRDFKLERCVIQQGRLDLRQGPKWPPDVGVSVHLFAERTEDLAGRTVVIEATRTNPPRTILRWKNEQGDPLSKDYRRGYALKVEFGQVTSNRLPGRIFIAFPDDPKSYAAGTFNAEIRRPSPKK